MSYHNHPHLTPLHEECNRVSRAIDEADWDGEFDEADALREELRYLDGLREKGDLYVPNF